MPEGAVYVGRPSRWGNDYRAGECMAGWWGPCDHHAPHRPATAADAVAQYRIVWEALAQAEASIGTMTSEELRLTGVSGIQVDLFEAIRGRDLACWCPPDQPCHADVLLELADPVIPSKESPDA